MQSSFRAISLASALAVTLGFCAGCSQGEGDRCEIPSDCAAGLVCTGLPHNSVCTRPSNPGSAGAGGSTSQDAAGPVSVADAASDGPRAAEVAVSDGPAAAADAGVDAPVVADGVNVDAPSDVEAVADLLATD